MSRITIAIDGPAASGKSTTAHAVATRLGYVHLNSGLLYRAITWAAQRGGWIDDDAAFEPAVEALDLRVVPDPPDHRVRVADDEPGPALQSAEVTARVSALAALGSVRAKVLGVLRAAGTGGGVVCDGRDIGTVVFPGAELKVFLVASAEERGRRRLLERGEPATPERIRSEAALLSARDESDATRELAPLRKAASAAEIDTTGLDPGEVVRKILALARQRGVGDTARVRE